MASPIRSWRELYTILGYPEPDDVELTRTVIITDYISPSKPVVRFGIILHPNSIGHTPLISAGAALHGRYATPTDHPAAGCHV